MTKALRFPEAAMLAIRHMTKHLMFAEVKRRQGGWKVVVGNGSSGRAPWTNLWRSIHTAIQRGDAPEPVFWSQLDRLVEIKDSTALAAAKEIAIEEGETSTVRESFFHKSSVHILSAYSKDSDFPSC